MTPQQKIDALRYLRGLVRRNITKRQKAVEGFAPKPGQDKDEADKFRAKLVSHQSFRRDVLDWLLSMEESLMEDGDGHATCVPESPGGEVARQAGEADHQDTDATW